MMGHYTLFLSLPPLSLSPSPLSLARSLLSHENIYYIHKNCLVSFRYCALRSLVFNKLIVSYVSVVLNSLCQSVGDYLICYTIIQSKLSIKYCSTSKVNKQKKNCFRQRKAINFYDNRIYLYL